MKILKRNIVRSEVHNDEHGGNDLVMTFEGTVEYNEVYRKNGTWKTLWIPTNHTRKKTGILKVKTQYWGITAARITRWVWWNDENVQSSELPFEIELGRLFGEVTMQELTDSLIDEFCK